ncbi:hypothetical protein CRUP_023759 [Coryphaenoides rupestris]|nr:hypothetical protein CRUP_023759 [Coryphaenoides rupestris]
MTSTSASLAALTAQGMMVQLMHGSSERRSDTQMLEAKARGAKVMAILRLKRGHAGAMKSLQTGVLLLGILLAQSEALNRTCFARFNLVSGQCEEELATCTELCGWGVVQRTRKCHGPECLGDQTTVENKPCESNECCPACSSSCGEGLQLSTRLCDNPAPQYGGQYCQGTSTQSTVCRNTCPVNGVWSEWADWGPCSGSEKCEDESGLQKRKRSCLNRDFGGDTWPVGNSCLGPALEDQSCKYLPNCPVNGSWGTWAPFGACSSSCGEGLQLLTRLCDNPAPQYGGQYCQGTSTQSTCTAHGAVGQYGENAQLAATQQATTLLEPASGSVLTQPLPLSPKGMLAQETTMRPRSVMRFPTVQVHLSVLSVCLSL